MAEMSMTPRVAILVLALLSLRPLPASSAEPLFSEPEDSEDSEAKEPPIEKPAGDICSDSLRIIYPSWTILSFGYSEGHLKKLNRKTFLFKDGGSLCVQELELRGRVRDLLRGGGVHGNPFLVSLRPEKKALVTEEVLDPQSSLLYPFLQWRVSCAEKPCSISAPACLLNPPKGIDAGVVQKVRAWRKNYSRNPPAEPPDEEQFESMIRTLLARSMTGDPEAGRLLMDPSFRMKDELNQESLQAARAVLARAKKSGCTQFMPAGAVNRSLTARRKRGKPA